MSLSEVKLYFVTTPTPNGRNLQSQILQAAFKSMRFRKLTPKWIDSTKLEQICNSATGEAIFVLDNFDSQSFKYLVSRECRIISPYVVKYCDDESVDPFETIPMRRHPVFSQCMRGLTVTCTNLPSDVKKIIEAKVVQMCGDYDSSLNAVTKFLVSDSVLTKKYQAAVRLKIPVMRVEWVDECWDKHQYEFIRANSPAIIQQYSLPIFHGLTITFSQFDCDERSKFKELVEKHGGIYSGPLRFDVPNTILLLKEKSGDKYTYAKRKKIPRLRIEWLIESIKAKYALSVEAFNIDADEFTAEEAASQTSQSQTNPTNGHLNGQAVVATSNASSSSHHQSPSRSNLNCLKDLADMLDELTVNVSDRSFLDNIVVFTVGFDDQSANAIKKAVRYCGAFFVAEFKPMVTHVIVGPAFTSTHELMKRFVESNMEKIVTIDWLISSLKASECNNYIPYKYDPSQPISDGTSSASSSIKHNIAKFDLFSTQAEEMCKQIDMKATLAKPEITKPSSQNFKSLAGDSDSDDEPVKWSPKVKMPLQQLEASSSAGQKASGMSKSSAKCKTATELSRSLKKKLDSDDENSIESDRLSKKRTGDTTEINSDDNTNDSTYDANECNDNYHTDGVRNEQSTINLDQHSDRSTEHTSMATTRVASYSTKPSGSCNSYQTSDCSSAEPDTAGHLSSNVLMFSGFSDDVKKKLTQRAKEKLHVEVYDARVIDLCVTHLILNEPFTTEKTIAAIAGGLWILVPQYFYDSLKAGRLLPEEEYQWGSQDLTALGQNSNRQRLMIASITWRKYTAETGQRAFHKWPVLLMNQNDVMESIENILTTGNANIHYIEDYRNRDDDLQKLLKKIKFALIDTNLKELPNFPRESYRNVLKYCIAENKLVRHEYLSRFILIGRPGEEKS